MNKKKSENTVFDARWVFSQAAKEQNCVRVKQATLAGAAVGKIIGTGSSEVQPVIDSYT